MGLITLNQMCALTKRSRAVKVSQGSSDGVKHTRCGEKTVIFTRGGEAELASLCLQFLVPKAGACFQGPLVPPPKKVLRVPWALLSLVKAGSTWELAPWGAAF